MEAGWVWRNSSKIAVDSEATSPKFYYRQKAEKSKRKAKLPHLPGRKSWVKGRKEELPWPSISVLFHIYETIFNVVGF